MEASDLKTYHSVSAGLVCVFLSENCIGIQIDGSQLKETRCVLMQAIDENCIRS